jgi:hypothetical protein
VKPHANITANGCESGGALWMIFSASVIVTTILTHRHRLNGIGKILLYPSPSVALYTHKSHGSLQILEKLYKAHQSV